MQLLGLFKFFGFGAVSAVLIYGGPSAGPGYMARIGPTTLRIRPEVHGNPAALLPPLKMNDDEELKPAPMPSAEQRDATAMQAQGIRGAENDFSDLPGDMDLASGEVRTPEPPRAEPTEAVGETIVAPQMLLRYFNRSTNDSAIISIPVEFTPPGAPVNRSSSATYISP
jgi:hypothetical protein